MREKRIKELADAVAHGHMTIDDVLNETWNEGYKAASDRAYAVIRERIPESEREQLAIDYIRAMIV